MSLRILVIPCLFVFIASALPEALGDSQPLYPNLFFDLSTQGFFGLENDGPAGFSMLKRDLEGRHYSLSDSFTRNDSLEIISNRTLNGTNTLFIVNPKRSLSSSETTPIMNFVDGGGNLVVICDTPDSIFFANQLLRPYGLFFRHEILMDVKVNLPSNEVISMSCAIPLASRIMDRSDLLFALKGITTVSRDIITRIEKTEQERPILMVLAQRRGKILALSSKDPFINSVYEDNKSLMHLVLDIIESNISKRIDLRYSPLELSVPIVDKKVAMVALVLENLGLTSIEITFEAGYGMEHVFSPKKGKVHLKPREKAYVSLEFRDEGYPHSYIESSLRLRVEDRMLNSSMFYEIPVITREIST